MKVQQTSGQEVNLRTFFPCSSSSIPSTKYSGVESGRLKTLKTNFCFKTETAHNSTMAWPHPTNDPTRSQNCLTRRTGLLGRVYQLGK